MAFGSSSPSGASSLIPFGEAATSSNPFGAAGQSNPFGGNQSPHPFGAKPFESSPFVVQDEGSLFGSKTGTGMFDPTQQTAFGGTSSAFGGSSTTPTFGTAATPFGGGMHTLPAFPNWSLVANVGTSSLSGAPAFGQKPTTSFGGFRITPAQSDPFRTFGQRQPGFASQPFGSTPTFGATSPPTPAFGSTAMPAYGSSTPAFGASSTPTFGATTSTTFGSSTPASGSSSVSSCVFGQSVPAFGSIAMPAFGSSTPAFGASSTPAFGATTSTPFGSSTPAFGSSSVFGQSAPASGATSSPAFGSSAFGSATTTPFGAPQSGSAFGATSFGASFGGQRTGSRVVPHAVTNDTDVAASGQVEKIMSISAMPAYNSKRPEELRWEDYQGNNKGDPNPAGQQPATGGIFGQTTPQSPGGTSKGGCGQQLATPNPFASTSTSSLFGEKPAPAFGQRFAQMHLELGQRHWELWVKTFEAWAKTFEALGTSIWAGVFNPVVGDKVADFVIYSLVEKIWAGVFNPVVRDKVADFVIYSLVEKIFD